MTGSTVGLLMPASLWRVSIALGHPVTTATSLPGDGDFSALLSSYGNIAIYKVHVVVWSMTVEGFCFTH